MQAWKLLFTSDIGLLTLPVFVVLFAMMAYFLWLFAIRNLQAASRTMKAICRT